MTTWHYTVEGRPVSGANSQRIFKAGGKRTVHKSKAAVAWRESAALQLRAQRGRTAPVATDCAVTLHIYRAVNAGDVDNFAKVILDAMQDAGVLDNDRHVAELHLYRHTDKARPRVEITVTVGTSQR